MWLVIKTDLYREDETRKFLLKLDGIRDVYLPMCRHTIVTESGEKRTRFTPTIGGIMMANVDEDKLDNLIGNWGYIVYKETVRNPLTMNLEEKTFTTRAHLLLCSSDIDVLTRKEMILKAKVPERDIERLRIFNDRQAEGIEDLRILDVSYEVLAAENDVVLITEGPYIGIQGVIKRVNTHGAKDRRLHFCVGNFTVSVPNANRYRTVVVRPASRGDKANEVNAWRHIDLLIGRIQASLPHENAAGLLRDILRQLNKDVRLDSFINKLRRDMLTGIKGAIERHELLTNMTGDETGALISLSRYFQTSDNSVDKGLFDIIPDMRLRPFLTPTPGADISDTEPYTLLSHNGLQEMILPVDLTTYFLNPATVGATACPRPQTVGATACPRPQTVGATACPRPQSPDHDDCLYYAHVGLLCESGVVTAVVDWGDFVRQYLLRDDRDALIRDFRSKEYVKTARLLETCNSAQSAIYIYDKNSISGFAINILPAAESLDSLDTSTLLHAVRPLLDACAPAAVEMWQGTSLLFWRKLTQRYVLLHK